MWISLVSTYCCSKNCKYLALVWEDQVIKAAELQLVTQSKLLRYALQFKKWSHLILLLLHDKFSKIVKGSIRELSALLLFTLV